ncbi:hypothetical protein DFH09DRAFT_1431019 [Mycena vulgaris]|nr:hypothetical protein DFH09DRAFT_1431019 [Mycena vulgaris]
MRRGVNECAVAGFGKPASNNWVDGRCDGCAFFYGKTATVQDVQGPEVTVQWTLIFKGKEKTSVERRFLNAGLVVDWRSSEPLSDLRDNRLFGSRMGARAETYAAWTATRRVDTDEVTCERRDLRNICGESVHLHQVDDWERRGLKRRAEETQQCQGKDQRNPRMAIVRHRLWSGAIKVRSGTRTGGQDSWSARTVNLLMDEETAGQHAEYATL